MGRNVTPRFTAPPEFRVRLCAWHGGGRVRGAKCTLKFQCEGCVFDHSNPWFSTCSGTAPTQKSTPCNQTSSPAPRVSRQEGPGTSCLHARGTLARGAGSTWVSVWECTGGGRASRSPCLPNLTGDTRAVPSPGRRMTIAPPECLPPFMVCRIKISFCARACVSYCLALAKKKKKENKAIKKIDRYGLCETYL